MAGGGVLRWFMNERTKYSVEIELRGGGRAGEKLIGEGVCQVFPRTAPTSIHPCTI